MKIKTTYKIDTIVNDSGDFLYYSCQLRDGFGDKIGGKFKAESPELLIAWIRLMCGDRPEMYKEAS